MSGPTRWRVFCRAIYCRPVDERVGTLRRPNRPRLETYPSSRERKTQIETCEWKRQTAERKKSDADERARAAALELKTQRAEKQRGGKPNPVSPRAVARAAAAAQDAAAAARGPSADDAPLRSASVRLFEEETLGFEFGLETSLGGRRVFWKAYRDQSRVRLNSRSCFTSAAGNVPRDASLFGAGSGSRRCSRASTTSCSPCCARTKPRPPARAASSKGRQRRARGPRAAEQAQPKTETAAKLAPKLERAATAPPASPSTRSGRHLRDDGGGSPPEYSLSLTRASAHAHSPQSPRSPSLGRSKSKSRKLLRAPSITQQGFVHTTSQGVRPGLGESPAGALRLSTDRPGFTVEVHSCF